MLNGIGEVVVAAEQKLSAVAAEALKQGQWTYISGADAGTGLEAVSAATIVNGTDHTDDAVYLLAPVALEPKMEEDLEGIETIASGARVIAYRGAGIELEDFYAGVTGDAARCTADWAGATLGDLCVLNADGFITLDGAGDDPGGSATPVAIFQNLKGTAVTYRTI